DVTAWADTWCVGSPRPAAVVWWLNRELADDRPTRRTLTAALLDHPDPDIRAGALWSSAALLDADLLPLIADRLPDEEPENRRLAATLLAAAGSPLPTDNRTPLATDRDPLRANAEHTSAEHAHTDRDPHNTNAEHASAEHTSVERGDHERTDREPRRNRRADTDFGRGIAVLGPFADDLALAARDVYLPAADAALAALALLGDHRAVEPLRHRLFGVRGMSPTRPRCRPWDLPSVTEVLTAMREHADALRPAVHARLSTTTDDAERQALQRVLASWPRQN
ncbi:MAG: hypothetical protein HOV94_09995, partial [Saccharothrix sp.]|nr:hypothetical protein [Saccharothrix sp.]